MRKTTIMKVEEINEVLLKAAAKLWIEQIVGNNKRSSWWSKEVRMAIKDMQIFWKNYIKIKIIIIINKVL